MIAAVGTDMAMNLRTRLLLMLGGIAGTALWAAQQRLDKRALHRGYDDVELLGRFVYPWDERWVPAGWAMHLANGAAFGLAYSELLRRLPEGTSPRAAAMAMAQVENVGLYPIAAIVDRVHPARGDISKAFGGREFAQATWRHAILGAVLGEVASRATRPVSRR
jgi:hypothetical protein